MTSRSRDPAALLITHDHYVTRLLHASGVDLAMLGVGGISVDPREVWRTVAAHWDVFAGTASGYWMEEELSGVLGVTEPLNTDSADRIYDHIQPAARDSRLSGPGHCSNSSGSRSSPPLTIRSTTWPGTPRWRRAPCPDG